MKREFIPFRFVEIFSRAVGLKHTNQNQFNNRQQSMGKKSKSLKNWKAPTDPKVSQFNAFANKLSRAKEKKIEKLHDTKQRVLATKYGMKGRIPKARKANKFSLVEGTEDPGAMRLQHRGKLISEMDHFNDVEFGVEQSNEELREDQENMQFTGFQEENQRDKRPKSKQQVYKEIIEKSKKYKVQRQKQYEENYEAAVDLDENLNELLPKLKFQSQTSKLREQLQNKDLEYERLLKEMQNQERIVPEKNLQKKKKETERHRRKKFDQLNQLLKQGDSGSGDIRGWANNQGSGDDSEEEGSQDEIDDVDLSSEGEQDSDQEASGSGEEGLDSDGSEGSDLEEDVSIEGNSLSQDL